jgi:23S rRNA pseudouridine1911/1915/1917 synthase
LPEIPPGDALFLTAPAAGRLDAVWQAGLGAAGPTRARLQDWIRDGRATVDDQVCRKPGQRLRGGERLGLRPEAVTAEVTPEAGELDVLFADAHLAVLDKPAGLTVHPAPGRPSGTLVHLLAHHFPELADMGGQRPGIVHRLDKDTSGLLVVARTEAARLALADSFAGRRVQKTYLALVHGLPEPPRGVVTLPIGRDPASKIRMAVLRKGGREAVSRYRTVWAAPEGRAALVEVDIETGRTHQIRVHMAAIGYPLLCDAVYGSGPAAAFRREAGAAGRRCRRQMLHAWRLSFPHPESGEMLSFERPPPADFWRMPLFLARRPQRVGVVGAPGSGKSALLAAFAAAGFPVFSADAAVAALYAPGGEAVDLLTRRYGDRFLAASGREIDRDALRAAVTASDSFRRELMDMVHPLVKQAFFDFLMANRAARAVFAEVPLLFEAGWHAAGLFDVILGVSRDRASREAALAARPGWTGETAARMEAGQWPEDRKLALCAVVVDNRGDMAALERQAATVLADLRRMRRDTLWGMAADLARAGYAPARLARIMAHAETGP